MVNRAGLGAHHSVAGGTGLQREFLVSEALSFCGETCSFTDLACGESCRVLQPIHDSAGGNGAPDPARAGVFATTHWSVVLSAGQPGSPRAAQALETLCRTYWHPLYGYIRRRAYEVPDAQDLTQEFFLPNRWRTPSRK